MRFFKTLAFLFLMSLTSQAFAGEYQGMFVFGDSLSDTGNLGTIAPEFFNPAGPYNQLRLTNDLVAVEHVAAGLGQGLVPSNHLLALITGDYSLIQGNNWAVSGARVVGTDEQSVLTSLATQIDTFIAVNAGQVPSEALYVITIGGNDIRAARDTGDLTAGAEIVRQAVSDAEAQFRKLLSAGAKYVMITDVSDIGSIPETKAFAQAFQNELLPVMTSGFSVQYNLLLKKAVWKLKKEFKSAKIDRFSIFRSLWKIIYKAEELGYTNSELNCWNAGFYPWAPAGYTPGCSLENINSWIFFDEVHPTKEVHKTVGLEMLKDVKKLND